MDRQVLVLSRSPACSLTGPELRHYALRDLAASLCRAGLEASLWEAGPCCVASGRQSHMAPPAPAPALSDAEPSPKQARLEWGPRTQVGPESSGPSELPRSCSSSQPPPGPGL